MHSFQIPTNRRTAIVLFACLILASPPVSGQTGGDALGALRQMLTAEKTLALTGMQVTIVTRGGREYQSTQQIIRNGAKFRLDYTAPPALAGEVIVDNGRLNWHYVPATNSEEISPSKGNRLVQNIPRVLRQLQQGRLTAQLVGQEVVAGHPCVIVQVGAAGSATAPTRRFWIDPANGAQLKIEDYNRNGRRQSVSYYTQVAYNPPLPPRAFAAPQMPNTVRIISPQPGHPGSSLTEAQAQAPFSILLPSYLPSGFRFQSASVSDFRRRTVVNLRYVNGLNVLSLFETSAPNGAPRNGRPFNRAGRNALVGWQSGVNLILVGSLGEDEMEKVLLSVH